MFITYLQHFFYIYLFRIFLFSYNVADFWYFKHYSCVRKMIFKSIDSTHIYFFKWNILTYFSFKYSLWYVTECFYLLKGKISKATLYFSDSSFVWIACKSSIAFKIEEKFEWKGLVINVALNNQNVSIRKIRV